MEDTHNTDTKSVSTPANPQTKAGEAPVGSPKKGGGKIIVAVAVVLLILAGAYLYYNRSAETGSTNAGVTQNSDVPDGPVARVNGVEISPEKYVAAFEELKQNAELQGADLTAPEAQVALQQEVLTILINTELLVQKAQSLDLTVSPEDVQTEYDTLVTQVGGESQLAATLANIQLSDDELRSNIADQILIRALIAQEVDTDAITVSDEEIQELYDQVAATGGELPPLSDVESEVAAQIRSNKEFELVSNFITTLREAASVELLI